MSRQRELNDLVRKRLIESMTTPAASGPRQLAATDAQRAALDRLRSDAAGATGPEAALRARRLATLAPVLQHQAASDIGAAQAADVESREAQIQSLLGLAAQTTGALTAAEEAERQRLAKVRQQAVSGVLDVGSRLVPGM